MNGRQNQYRLQHWQLAERQRYLADLEALVARLRLDIADLDREIEAGSGSGVGVDMQAVLPMFLGPLLDRRDKLVGTIAEIDVQIVEAREAVAATQQEVKLVEGSVAYRGFTFDDRRMRRGRRPV